MALRLIEMVSKNPVDISTEVFAEKLDIIDSWSGSIKEGSYQVRILVMADKTESIINALEKHWGLTPEFRILIYEVEATLPVPEEKEAKNDSDQKPEKEDPKRVACAELVQRLSGLVKLDRIYFITIILSTIVAAIGLMRSNTAIIIGAMVIAPLLSPNMMLSLATTLGDVKLARKAIIITGCGLGSSLIVSIIIGFFVPFDSAIPEIMSRTEVHLSDIILAFAAGSAGALAFTTGISAALVGVMVAVALLPPLVIAGLFAGSAEWILASKALMLLLTNIICINISGIATFLFQGVRPRYWRENEIAKRIIIKAVSIWILLLLVLVVLIVYSG